MEKQPENMHRSSLNKRNIPYWTRILSGFVKNRTVSVIGNSSWVPDISVKKITETAVGWKNCTILGDAVNIASAVGAKEDRELEVLAGILAQDILK